MCVCRAGEGLSGAQRFGHLGQDPLEALVADLLRQDLECLENGNSGLHEDGELSREMHQLPTGNLLTGDLELENALLLDDVNRRQIALDERSASHAGGDGRLDPRNSRTLGSYGPELELRHGDPAASGRVDGAD